MSTTEFESPLECQAKLHPLDRAGRSEQGNVGKISHPRIGPPPRHGKGMQFLGDVGNHRVQAERRRSDTGKAEEVVGHRQIRFADERIPESYIYPERSAITGSRQSAFGAIAEAVVLQPIVSDVGMLRIRVYLEEHGIAQVEATGSLKSIEDLVGGAHHAQIYVLRGSSTIEPHFEHESALERHRIANHQGNPGEKPIEDEQLAAAREINAMYRGGSEPLFECLLEGEGCWVAMNQGVPSDARSSAVLSSTESLSEISPRRRA